MKTLLFAVLSLSSIFANAETTKSIYVTCGCSYYVDYLLVDKMVYGKQTNVTQQDIDNCKIEKGKVVEGCGLAKMNAQWNCQELSKKSNPNQVIGSGYIHEQTCFGAIE